MRNVVECPHCGNAVEGHIVRSTTSKMIRSVIKKGGMKAALTAAGSVIPGVGNVAGFVAGTALDAIFDKQIGEMVDNVADTIVEDTVYSFSCPNCGHTWTQSESKATDSPEETISYYAAKREACIASYVFYIHAQRIIGNQLTDDDRAEIINQVYNETGVTVHLQDFDQGTIGLRKKLSECLPNDINSWQSLENFMDINEQESDFSLVVETLYCDSDGLNAVFGFIESGSVCVGDTIILQVSDEDDNEVRWSVKITWIEWNGDLYQCAPKGCFVGLGFDADSQEIPSSIYGAIKEGEFTATLSSEEMEYSSEVEELIADGEISQRELR